MKFNSIQITNNMAQLNTEVCVAMHSCECSTFVHHTCIECIEFRSLSTVRDTCVHPVQPASLINIKKSMSMLIASSAVHCKNVSRKLVPRKIARFSTSYSSLRTVSWRLLL